jgi:hypothetical protein
MTLAGIPSTYLFTEVYSFIRRLQSIPKTIEMSENFLLADDWNVLKWMAQSLAYLGKRHFIYKARLVSAIMELSGKLFLLYSIFSDI